MTLEHADDPETDEGLVGMPEAECQFAPGGQEFRCRGEAAPGHVARDDVSDAVRFSHSAPYSRDDTSALMNEMNSLPTEPSPRSQPDTDIDPDGIDGELPPRARRTRPRGIGKRRNRRNGARSPAPLQPPLPVNEPALRAAMNAALSGSTLLSIVRDANLNAVPSPQAAEVPRGDAQPTLNPAPVQPDFTEKSPSTLVPDTSEDRVTVAALNAALGAHSPRDFSIPPAGPGSAWKWGLAAVTALAVGASLSGDRLHPPIAAESAPAVAAAPAPVPAVVAAPEAAPVEQSGPVYHQVLDAFEDSPQKDLQVAVTTNALVNALELPAERVWNDTPLALNRLERKLETWGGYEAVLASGRSCAPESISGFLQCVRHSELPHAGLVADRLEKQVSAIQDSTIVPDQKAVATRHEAMRSKVETAVAEVKAHPPVAPRAWSAEEKPVPGVGSSVGSLYDAPEPGNLRPAVETQLVHEHEDIPDVTAFLEEEIDVTAVPEPLHVRAPFDAVETAFFKSGEARAATVTEPSPPVKAATWKDKLSGAVSSAVSSVKSGFGKWFG